MIGLIIGITFLVLFLLFLILSVVFSIKIVAQADFVVVERLGKYSRTLTTGLNFIIPWIERVVLRENLKEKVFDFSKQDVITKDNATIKVDTVVYLQITDPKLFVYGVEHPIAAVENLTATTLRNLLGELELDQTLTSRETVNSKLTIILDEASDSWGIKVNRVELKNIIPPFEIQSAMEKQMRAEREKRANILEAEGFKAAAILKAEGEKEATILSAQARKQSQILQAEAVKESEILVAEGQKKAIEMLKNAELDKKVLVWKSLEQIEKVANGKATKIIIPPNLQNLAGTMATLGTVLNDEKGS
ncbi:SFPH/Band 7/PHB domain-containing protein [[Mycoplasma] cavipharyngis]|uniref:SPFH domain-containing protein n=1 Tax=[Mycoplasma] cavipharyngis TaxID=92757 RepID=UPI003703ADEC